MKSKVLARGTIPETTGTARPGCVVLGGLPMARGAVAAGGRFRLRMQAGTDHPVEGTPAAFWPDGSVKWLRLCGAVDVAASAPNAFELEAADGDAPAGLTVRALPGIFEISGGPLTVRVSPDSHRALEVRDAAGRLRTRGPGLSAQIQLLDPDGRPRPAVGWTFEPGKARVVAEGPERVVVRLGGRFEEAGRLVGELVTFIEVVRGEPRLGIQPVFIYLGDPDRDRIAALTVTLHTVHGGDKARFGFGQDRAAGYWDDCQWVEDGPKWAEARLVQAGSSFYRLDKRTGPAAGWVKIREGRRARGWMHLGDPTGGVTGGMRYMWQEYPRSLAVDAETGTLSFGLVPEAGEALDLRRYTPVVLGATVYEAGEGGFPAQSHGATGIAKSNELMAWFHGSAAAPREAEQAGLFWSEPVRIVPHPAEFAARGVAGPLAVTPAKGFEENEEELVRLTDWLFAERETQGWYGLMNWGDMVSSYYSERGQWAFDDGGYAWVNTEGLPDLGLWLMALRHGRADWLEGVIAMTRHNRDVDMYHRGNFKGVGTRHNVNHWGCQDKEWRVSMPLVKRFHDYVTGDPWTREVILETVAVYQSYERTAGAAPSMASALAGVMVKAEMTGDAKDRETLLKLLDLYATAVGPDGQFARSLHANLATGEGHVVDNGQNLMGSYFFLQTFGGQHTLVEAAETWDHANLRESLARHAALCAFDTFDMTQWKGFQVPSKHDAMLFLALAWRATGDTRFRDVLEEQLRAGGRGGRSWRTLESRGGEGLWDEPKRLELVGLGRRNKILCSLGSIMHLWPYGYKALGAD